jgi:hypothetical protein
MMKTSAFAIDFVITLDAINRYRTVRGYPPLQAPAVPDGGIHFANRFRTSPDGILCRVSVIDGAVAAWSKVIDQHGTHTWMRLLDKHSTERACHADPTGTFRVECEVVTEIGLSALADLAMERRKVTLADGDGVAGSVTVIDLGVL